jgi:YihY family inner membrane protein
MSEAPQSAREILLSPREVVGLLWRSLKSFRANQGLLLSGAVAYYLLLSIVPLLALTLAGLSQLFSKPQVLTTISEYMEILFPGSSRALIGEFETFLSHTEVISLFSVLVMLFFSSLAFSVLENAMSVIFFHRVKKERRKVWISVIIPYLYIGLVSAGLLLITGIAGLLSAVQGKTVTVLSWTFTLEPLTHGVLYVLGVGGLVFLFTSLYIVMPVIHIRPRHALLGGVIATALWEVVRHVLMWYFNTLSMVNLIYGSLATAIVALLSLEIGAMILLIGAQVIAEYERLLGGGKLTDPVPGMQTAE